MRTTRSIFFAMAGLSAFGFTLPVVAQEHQHMMTEPEAVQADARRHCLLEQLVDRVDAQRRQHALLLGRCRTDVPLHEVVGTEQLGEGGTSVHGEASGSGAAS